MRPAVYGCGEVGRKLERSPLIKTSKLCWALACTLRYHQVMPDASTIIVRFGGDAGQWLAYFEHAPQIGFGGDIPVGAVRRLLEGIEAAPGTYPLVCDTDRAGNGILHRELNWQPPEILFTCSTCGGTGEYVGLSDVGVCQVCGGRKLVPV